MLLVRNFQIKQYYILKTEQFNLQFPQKLFYKKFESC